MESDDIFLVRQIGGLLTSLLTGIAVAFSVNNISAAAWFFLIGGVFDSAGQTAAASIIQKDSSTVRGSAFGIQAFLWASVQHHLLQLL